MESEFGDKGSLFIKALLYIQISLNLWIPFLALLTIFMEDSVTQMLMDFVALIVITEMDNWYGVFFEIFLDAFY